MMSTVFVHFVIMFLEVRDMKPIYFWITEAAALVLSIVGLEKDIALLGATGMAVFLVFPFYYIFTRTQKKKEEQRTETRRPTQYTEYLWLSDTEDIGNKFFKAYKEDLEENDDYHMTKKEILDTYFDGDKIYKYEPFSLPFKVENNKVYSFIEKNDWICVGTIKKRDMAKYEQSKYTELHLMPNFFKKVNDESVEADQGDSYFGLEVTLPIE